MSAIKDYLHELEMLIHELPCKLFADLQVENRGGVALYLKGKIIFTNKSELQFKEYFITIPIMKKLAYSYHYQNKDKELVFKYDNAEHYKEIATYPYVTNDVFTFRHFIVEGSYKRDTQNINTVRLFQSSFSPKTGCYEIKADVNVNTHEVSILIQPEDWMLHYYFLVI